MDLQRASQRKCLIPWCMRLPRCATPASAKGVSVVTADDVAALYGDKPPRRRERTAVAAAEADAMYDATVAAAAARRESGGGAAYGEREQRRGPAAREAAVGGRGRPGRRAAVHLEDEEGACRVWRCCRPTAVCRHFCLDDLGCQSRVRWETGMLAVPPWLKC